MPRWNPFRRNQGLPLYDKPARERHAVSVTCSILSIICMITALSLPQWATSGSTVCNCVFGLTKVHCVNPNSASHTCEDLAMTLYYKTSHEILISCILSISVLTIISSSVATFISFGYPREKLEFIRHFSVFNIVSLLCIILVAGFWLAVCETLPVSSANEDQSKFKDTVSFGYAFYVYISSGIFTLCAACLNLIRARSAAERRRQHRRHFRQRLLNLRRPHRYSQLPPQQISQSPNSIRNENINEGDNPPEYVQIATTTFMGDNDEDTESLVPPPPPYVP